MDRDHPAALSGGQADFRWRGGEITRLETLITRQSLRAHLLTVSIGLLSTLVTLVAPGRLVGLAAGPTPSWARPTASSGRSWDEGRGG